MIRLHYRTILFFIIASTVQKQKKHLENEKGKGRCFKILYKKNIKTQNESESSQQLDTILALAPRLKLLSV